MTTLQRRAASPSLAPAAGDEPSMKLLIVSVILSFLGIAAALAYGSLHKQVDPATGVTTWRYRPPPPAERKPAPAPAKPVAAARASSAAAPARAPAQVLARPAEARGFPQVPQQLQNERDSERRRILVQELALEQAELEQAIVARAASERVARLRANVAALQREIASTP
jgi:hypothetical protein